MMGRGLVVAAAALVVCGSMSGGVLPANAGSLLSRATDLVTTYRVVEPGFVEWLTCGVMSGRDGCYSVGMLSGFERPCALLQGDARTDGNVVTRAIYVLDGRMESGAGLALWVYRRSDAVMPPSDVVSVKLVAVLHLPEAGGFLAESCFLAGNSHSVYVGSSASPVAVRVDKRTFSVSVLTDPSAAALVASITADDDGNVAVVAGGAGQESFTLYGPDDALLESGVGAPRLANTRAGSELPVITGNVSSRVSTARR